MINPPVNPAAQLPALSRRLAFLFPRSAVVLASAILLLACSKSPAPAPEPAPGAPPASINSTRLAAPPARLGHLEPFRRIAAGVTVMVANGDLVAARARIKDLEVAWNEAKAGLKPRAPRDWHALDKAIDRALEALRADSPLQSECAARLSELLAQFGALQAAPGKQGS